MADNYEQLLEQASITTTTYIEAHKMSIEGQYTIEVEGRSKVQESLKAAGVPTTVHYPISLNKQPAVEVTVFLSVGNDVEARVISLPTHPCLTAQSVVTIVSY